MSRCPKCKTVDLKMAGRGGTPALRCYQCHGMWISLKEAEELVMRGAIRDPLSMPPERVEVDHVAGLCPEGHGILARARVEGPEPFYLDRCSRCLGVWFDGGEWARLASLHLESNLADLWDPERRRRQLNQRIEAGHRARMVELAGAPLIDEIDALAEKIERHPASRDVAGYLKQKLGV